MRPLESHQPQRQPVANNENHGKKFDIISKWVTVQCQVSAAFLLSLLLSCMAAPAPIVPLDPISLGAITASFGLAEGKTDPITDQVLSLDCQV